MQVTVEATGPLERRMMVEVPEGRIAEEVESRLKTMGRTARVHGFRPGKAPMRVLERNYGRKVRQEVVSEVLQSSFAEALSQQSLNPAAGPTIAGLQAEPGEGLRYTAVFEVYPQVAVPDVSTLNLTRTRAEVTEADVDGMLETLRRQRRTWESVERAAAMGDQATIDFRGTVEGQDFAGNEGRQVTVELGSGRLIPGFEEGLAGLSKGEVKELSLTFPADYQNGGLAGKAVVFTVTVHGVQEARLPEVDAAFAQGFGVESGDLAELRREVRANMERELSDTLRARLKEQVMDTLLSGFPVDAPKALVLSEAEHLRRQTMEGLAGRTTGNIDLPVSLFEEQARRRVALGLLIAEVVRTNGITADPERVRQRVEAAAASYQDPESVVRWYYAERGRLAEMESLVVEDAVVDWVLERAQVTDQSQSFDEVMKPRQTATEGGVSV